MKILFISNLYPPHYVGGYELVCATTNRAMQARGHTTRVLTSNHQVEGVPMTAEEGVERTLRIHGFFGHPWLGIGPLRALEFHNNQAVRRAVGEFKPDVVFVFNLGGLSKSLIVTLQRLDVPLDFFVSDHWIARSLEADVWLSWWNRPNLSLPARVLRAVWTVAGRRAAWDAMAPTVPPRQIRFRRLQFCSRSLLEFTASKGYDVRHGDVTYNAVDTGRFSGAVQPASHPMSKLLYVGRLAEDKGVMTALKALAAIKGKWQGELSIVGKGDAGYTAQLHEFARAEQLPVKFLSGTAAEMPEIYRTHDALLFTSEWEEPFALTPLEAMACGLPVIGTTTGGSAEIFRHGENALTYPAGDAAALAARILDFAADPAMRARVAAAGQADVLNRFTEPLIMGQREKLLVETVRCWKTNP